MMDEVVGRKEFFGWTSRIDFANSARCFYLCLISLKARDNPTIYISSKKSLNTAKRWSEKSTKLPLGAWRTRPGHTDLVQGPRGWP